MTRLWFSQSKSPFSNYGRHHASRTWGTRTVAQAPSRPPIKLTHIAFICLSNPPNWYIPIHSIHTGVFTHHQTHVHQKVKKVPITNIIALGLDSEYSCMDTYHCIQWIWQDKDDWFCGDATASSACGDQRAAPGRERRPRAAGRSGGPGGETLYIHHSE